MGSNPTSSTFIGSTGDSPLCGKSPVAVFRITHGWCAPPRRHAPRGTEPRWRREWPRWKCRGKRHEAVLTAVSGRGRYRPRRGWKHGGTLGPSHKTIPNAICLRPRLHDSSRRCTALSARPGTEPASGGCLLVLQRNVQMSWGQPVAAVAPHEQARQDRRGVQRSYFLCHNQLSFVCYRLMIGFRNYFVISQSMISKQSRT